MKEKKEFEVAVLGGGGHVGFPLSVTFASRGLKTLIYDINEAVLAKIACGVSPFFEKGSEPLLKDALESGNLRLTTDASRLKGASTVVITIGTPVDEFTNPVIEVLRKCLDSLEPYLDDSQTVILRSTVCPGVTEWLARRLKSKGIDCAVAFCPERVVQGLGIEEITSFPQIVSGVSILAEERAAELFRRIVPEVVVMKPVEAELAKLFSNAYRYINFATVNQFYMICSKAGVDFTQVRAGMTYNYPRNQGMPSAGFAAGPCLFKDTMQLNAYFNNQFTMGLSAMNVNEGLAQFLVDSLDSTTDLSDKTVGILGMAFKANSDDARASLSYKLKKVLTFRSKEVLTSDPFVQRDPELIPVEDLVSRSDIIFIGAPHDVYRDLDLKDKWLVDVWNFVGKGSLVQ